MDYTMALEKLHAFRQEHLLIYWNKLTLAQQKHLLKQIQSLDIKTFHSQQELVKNKEAPLLKELSPFSTYEFSKGDDGDSVEGLQLIKKGYVGCLIVAGGTGSRLHYNGPKGMFPISLIRKKSLFEMLADKVKAAAKQVSRELSIAIMTSPLNHEATIHFFEERNFFGLNSNNIHFFQQKMLPSLDVKGNLILEDFYAISEGPDGNGSALHEFIKTGIWADWKNKGIKYVNFILIDNALANPFDEEFIGYHVRKSAQISIKCAERNHANENVGLVVQAEGKIQIVEYSEMPLDQKTNNVHSCANLGMFCFSMDFIKETENYIFPLHLAHKSVKFLDKKGIIQNPDQPNAYKFEKYIFDILPKAERVEVLLYPREKCFAPLKNFKGADSPLTVQEILQKRDRQIWASITGTEAPTRSFELSQEFYYPTQDLKRKWLGKKLPNLDYIEP